MIKINTISIIFFLMFATSCADRQKSIDCSKLKTGKFEYRGGFGNKHIIIERNDSIQTEWDEATDVRLKLRIEWTGSCDYKLTFLSININGKDSVVDKSGTPFIMTTIQTITKGYYICTSKTSDKNTPRTDTMLIIKPGS